MNTEKIQTALKRFGIVSGVLFKNGILYIVQENTLVDKTFELREYIKNELDEDIIVKDVTSLPNYNKENVVPNYNEEDVVFIFKNLA